MYEDMLKHGFIHAQHPVPDKVIDASVRTLAKPDEIRRCLNCTRKRCDGRCKSEAKIKKVGLYPEICRAMNRKKLKWDNVSAWLGLSKTCIYGRVHGKTAWKPEEKRILSEKLGMPEEKLFRRRDKNGRSEN